MEAGFGGRAGPTFAIAYLPTTYKSGAGFDGAARRETRVQTLALRRAMCKEIRPSAADSGPTPPRLAGPNFEATAGSAGPLTTRAHLRAGQL